MKSDYRKGPCRRWKFNLWFFPASLTLCVLWAGACIRIVPYSSLKIRTHIVNAQPKKKNTENTEKETRKARLWMIWKGLCLSTQHWCLAWCNGPSSLFYLTWQDSSLSIWFFYWYFCYRCCWTGPWIYHLFWFFGYLLCVIDQMEKINRNVKISGAYELMWLVSILSGCRTWRDRPRLQSNMRIFSPTSDTFGIYFHWKFKCLPINLYAQ